VDTLTVSRSELTFFKPKPAPTLGRADAGLLILLVLVIGGVFFSRYSRWPRWRSSATAGLSA
jgi:hypothetical protein